MNKKLCVLELLCVVTLFAACSESKVDNKKTTSENSSSQLITKEQEDSSTNTSMEKWKMPKDMRNSLINEGHFSEEFVDKLSQKDFETALEKANEKLNTSGVGDISRLFYELDQMFPGNLTEKNESIPQPADENNVPTDEVSNATQNNTPTGEWVETFKNTLYKEYQVTPSEFKFLGNDRWGVWVNEVDTGDNPYVTVNSETGDFHG